jgi:hypothetical protein
METSRDSRLFKAEIIGSLKVFRQLIKVVFNVEFSIAFSYLGIRFLRFFISDVHIGLLAFPRVCQFCISGQAPSRTVNPSAVKYVAIE